ncbi:hypothetical protein GCM10009634_66840 [Saccharothrix xinjiangensis]
MPSQLLPTNITSRSCAAPAGAADPVATSPVATSPAVITPDNRARRPRCDDVLVMRTPNRNGSVRGGKARTGGRPAGDRVATLR